MKKNQIEYLSLTNISDFGKYHLLSLGYSLKNNHSLKKIRLSKSPFSDESINNFKEALSDHSTLKEIIWNLL